MAPLENSLSEPAEFFAADVDVQVDLPLANAIPDDWLVAAELAEQLPEEVELNEPPLLEEMLHELAFATCVEIGVIAFEVGRQLRFDEEKTARIVNYLLEKRFIRKTKFDIPINTGDPPPQRKFLIVFITSQGIDELETEKPEVKASAIYNYYGDAYQTKVTSVDKSNIQIGSRGSTQSMDISEGKRKELLEILNQLKEKASDLEPGQREEVHYDIVQLEQTISSSDHDKTRLERVIGSLYTKLKENTPLLEFAIQLAD